MAKRTDLYETRTSGKSKWAGINAICRTNADLAVSAANHMGIRAWRHGTMVYFSSKATGPQLCKIYQKATTSIV